MLMTAFGAFGDNASNPTEAIARRLLSEHASDIRVEVLPVEYEAARKRIQELGNHDVHLALGLAADREVATLERFAINRMDSPHPDNAGYAALDEQITDGPLALEATIPVKELIASSKTAGFTLEESLSAGLYVCNVALYTGIETSSRAGFLHLPSEEHLDLDTGYRLVEFLISQLHGR